MFRGIGLIPNWQKENAAQVVETIKAFFAAYDIPVYIAPPEEPGTHLPPSVTGYQAWGKQVDMAIVLGGDGTILRAARMLNATEIPLVGVNMGKKGFLAEIEPQNLIYFLEKLVAGKYQLENRMMLHTHLLRKNEILNSFVALNDVVISRGPFSRIIRLNTFINKDFLQSFPGDGVIIATPTGSTGYSLSAGGPVVKPTLETLIINPICPHLLHNRAVVVGRDELISVTVQTKNAEVFLTIDGQDGLALQYDDTVEISRAAHYTKVATFSGDEFYRLLHKKIL